MPLFVVLFIIRFSWPCMSTAKKQNNNSSSSITWTTEQIQRNVFRVIIPYSRAKSWESWCLLSGDRHIDNPKSNHDLQYKHLEQVRERGACVLDIGDLVDAMAGKYDKRMNKALLIPYLAMADNYFDALTDYCADFLAKYAKHFVMLGVGNHEQAITDRHEINLVDRVVAILNREQKANIHNGGYGGYVLFRFVRDNEGGGGGRTCIALKYQHGTGGGAPVTGGVMDSYHKGLSHPDADIYVSGHLHNSYFREIAQERIDKISGARRMSVQTQIRTPSYKDSYGDNFGGWENAKMGMPPKPQGAFWLRFYYDTVADRVVYDVIKAN